jgi:hypothetical protein
VIILPARSLRKSCGNTSRFRGTRSYGGVRMAYLKKLVMASKVGTSLLPGWVCILEQDSLARLRRALELGVTDPEDEVQGRL